MKYVIISNRRKSDYIFQDADFVFWQDEFCGYTADINKAGVYTLEQIKKGHYSYLPIVDKPTKRVKHDNYIVDLAVFAKYYERYYGIKYVGEVAQ